MKAESLLIVAMVLCGFADCARADEPVKDPCAILLPPDPLPKCRLDGVWETCPTALLAYTACEQRILRAQVADLQIDLATSRENVGKQAASTAWYKTEADDARRHEGSIQTRTVWAVALAAGGGASAAGGSVAAANGHVAGGAIAVGIGALVVGLAYLLTR